MVPESKARSETRHRGERRSRINLQTKVGQLYVVLREANGGWLSNWHLTSTVQLSAVSTRISELRKLLPEGEVIETEQRREHGQTRWYYRLVRHDSPPTQMDLAGAKAPWKDI